MLEICLEAYKRVFCIPCLFGENDPWIKFLGKIEGYLVDNKVREYQAKKDFLGAQDSNAGLIY